MIHPFFVAELSSNHGGSLSCARELVVAASESGAHAVKLQTFTPESMTLDLSRPEFTVDAEHQLWGGRSLYSLYSEAYTPWEWHQELFELATSLGMTGFSTPFDTSAVDFLETLNVPIYKVASLELNDEALVKRIAQTHKPVIMSTGAATLLEVAQAVTAARDQGVQDLTLLLCTSSYPADPVDANLSRMRTLRDIFGVHVGLSDHTMGIGVAIAAVLQGASVIERHLTLDRQNGALDSAFSLTPHEFKSMVVESTAAIESIGEATWKISESEHESRRLRRSLYVISDVRAGDPVSAVNVRAIRAEGGLAPYLSWFGSWHFSRDVSYGEPLTLDMITKVVNG